MKLRERFEAMSDIQIHLEVCEFDESGGVCEALFNDVEDSLHWINGAWFMFQELNK